MAKTSFPKEKIKIVLFENIHANGVQHFKEEGFLDVTAYPSAYSGEALVEKIQDAHLVGIRSATHLNKAVLEKCTKLLSVGCFCIGTNQVDLKTAEQLGIPVFNDPFSNSRSVAEMVIGLIIVLMRDLFSKSEAIRKGEWRKISKGSHEVRGKTLGIIGYGRIGSQTALLAEALGMSVIYHDIEQKLPLANAKKATLDEVLSLSDIVTLHVPETSLTQKMIGLKELKKMKKSAYLINTSRGQVVNLEELEEALNHKIIAGAAIDVFYKEPNDNSELFKHPLQHYPNVILTPHVGGATEEAQSMIGLSVSGKLIHFVNRGSTEGAVNFPELSLSPNENTHRILHIHQNIPGVLSELNTLMAKHGINIVGQYLKTTNDIGYVVFDIEKRNLDFLDDLKKVKGTIRARILY